MNIKLILSALLVIGFAGLGVTDAVKQKHQLKVKDIQLNTKAEQVKQLEVKHQTIDTQLQTELKQNQVDQQKVKQLEEEKRKADERIRELEARKAEKARLANAPVKTPPPAQKPVRVAATKPQPKESGGCGGIRAKLARLGVPANQLDSAIRLAVRESGCNEFAVNRNGGACGAFQSLPCGKWGSPGTDQYYKGAINYANSRYGGYNGALSHSLRHNWY